MKKLPLVIVLLLTITSLSITGCTQENNNRNDENYNTIENSKINDLDLILTANQDDYQLNGTDNIIVNITLVNVNKVSVYIEEQFDFFSTIKYKINGMSNAYYEEYEGPKGDYLPKKEIMQPDGKKGIQFILMNEIRFEKIYDEVGINTYGNYNFTVVYSSAFTEGVVHSNNFEFEIIE